MRLASFATLWAAEDVFGTSMYASAPFCLPLPLEKKKVLDVLGHVPRSAHVVCAFLGLKILRSAEIVGHFLWQIFGLTPGAYLLLQVFSEPDLRRRKGGAPNVNV